MGKLRVGVIGAGRMGQHHARHLAANERCELCAVVDVNESTAAKTARQYDAKAFTDYREVLGKLDAVSIVVPTDLHYEVTKDFLEAGVHTLIEKPITNDVDEARSLIEMARQRNLVLQVGHIERFNAAIRKLRETLTTPRFVEIHRIGPYDPRVKDVGVVLDLMIHDLDILLHVVGSPLTEIDAVGVPILSPTEDIANVRLRFAGGCIANLSASRVTPNKKRKIRIFQDDAYIEIDYDKQSMEIYRRVELPRARDADSPKFEIVRKRIRLRLEDKIQLQADHFLDCVERGAQPLVDGEAAAQALDAAVRISEQIRSRAKPYFDLVNQPIRDEEIEKARGNPLENPQAEAGF